MTKKLYKLMNWPAIEEIIYSEASDPHALLGPHTVGNGTLIQMFAPGAKRAQVQFLKDMSEAEWSLWTRTAFCGAAPGEENRTIPLCDHGCGGE